MKQPVLPLRAKNCTIINLIHFTVFVKLQSTIIKAARVKTDDLFAAVLILQALIIPENPHHHIHQWQVVS